MILIIMHTKRAHRCYNYVSLISVYLLCNNCVTKLFVFIILILNVLNHLNIEFVSFNISLH